MIGIHGESHINRIFIRLTGIEKEIIRLYFCHTIFIDFQSCMHCILSQLLLLTVNTSSQGIASTPNSNGPLQGPPQFSLQGVQLQFPPLVEKNPTPCYSFCHWLSLVEPLVVTRLSLYKRSCVRAIQLRKTHCRLLNRYIYFCQLNKEGR